MNQKMRKHVKRIWKRGPESRRQDPLMLRAWTKDRIDVLAEDGKVAVVFGFVDCDGGRVDNWTAVIPAQVPAFERWIDRFLDSLDGPQHWYRLVKPSYAAQLEATEQDLALEAFENGHRHTICI